jgi:hypothetical protein
MAVRVTQMTCGRGAVRVPNKATLRPQEPPTVRTARREDVLRARVAADARDLQALLLHGAAEGRHGARDAREHSAAGAVQRVSECGAGEAVTLVAVEGHDLCMGRSGELRARARHVSSAARVPPKQPHPTGTAAWRARPRSPPPPRSRSRRGRPQWRWSCGGRARGGVGRVLLPGPARCADVLHCSIGQRTCCSATGGATRDPRRAKLTT